LDLDLDFSQYLMIVELLDVASLSVGTLGTGMDIDPGAVTPLINRLERPHS